MLFCLNKEMEYILRELRNEDAKSMQKHADNPKVAQNLRNGFPTPYKLQDAENFIAIINKQPKEKGFIWGIEVEGEIAGSIGITFNDLNDVYAKAAELGYWLGEKYWGRGIMNRAVREICDYTFENFDIVRIIAEPYAYNLASRKVLEKAGFELEGIMRKSVFKNGKIYDSCMYAMIQ